MDVSLRITKGNVGNGNGLVTLSGNALQKCNTVAVDLRLMGTVEQTNARC